MPSVVRINVTPVKSMALTHPEEVALSSVGGPEHAIRWWRISRSMWMPSSRGSNACATTGPARVIRCFLGWRRRRRLEQMKWFIEQEVAGEAGFDDLLAFTQVKMPEQAKLEMARNFWDEMGRGASKGMHGPMLERLAHHVDVHPTPESVIPEALALGNLMVAFAHNRRYAFHSIGALGVIEMTAPTRAGYVDRALRRLAIPAKKRHYFALHAVLDVRHSETWNREVLRPLVAEDPRRARAIGEGAVLRLWHGARCFERYRQKFSLSLLHNEAA